MLIVLPIVAGCAMGVFSAFPRDPDGGTAWEGKRFTDHVHALLCEYNAPLRDRRRLAIYTLLMFLVAVPWLLGACGIYLAVAYFWRPHDAARMIIVALLFGVAIVWIRIGHRAMGGDQRRS